MGRACEGGDTMAWVSHWGSGYYADVMEQYGTAQVNNAKIIKNFLMTKGFNFNAVCAMLGNMMTESYLNPGQWQHGYNPWDGNASNGMGLVGWTPYWRITDWLASHGCSLDDAESYGYGMLDKLVEECFNPQEVTWIATSNYPLSFQEFVTDTTHDIAWLANAFLYNYERPAVTPQPIRAEQALKWAEILKDTSDQTVIEKAVTWARQIAADPAHGYDQAHRDGPDYDCSSLICWAYYNAGLNTRPGYTPATFTMYEVFTAAGFIDVTGQINLAAGTGLQYGDVLLNVLNHTAMYIGDGQVVQASINELGTATGGQTGDQTGGEIWERSYYNYPWDYVLRYTGGTVEPSKVAFVRWIPA